MGDPAAVPVAIALGSNLGDRLSHLEYAVERLRALLAELRVSSWYDTAPAGVEPQPRFLNGAVIGRTTCGAVELLEALLRIESDRGRERPRPGAPRTLDLDLILYGDEIITTPRLRVPHPHYRARRFVLDPLAEIAPDWRDPETGDTVAALKRDLEERERRRVAHADGR